MNLRPALDMLQRLRAPVAPPELELDDPDHDDQEPELTDDDLAGRLSEATPIEQHEHLGDES
jgi:hypothetical protein